MSHLLPSANNDDDDDDDVTVKAKYATYALFCFDKGKTAVVRRCHEAMAGKQQLDANDMATAAAFAMMALASYRDEMTERQKTLCADFLCSVPTPSAEADNLVCMAKTVMYTLARIHHPYTAEYVAVLEAIVTKDRLSDDELRDVMLYSTEARRWFNRMTYGETTICHEFLLKVMEAVPPAPAAKTDLAK